MGQAKFCTPRHKTVICCPPLNHQFWLRKLILNLGIIVPFGHHRSQVHIDPLACIIGCKVVIPKFGVILERHILMARRKFNRGWWIGGLGQCSEANHSGISLQIWCAMDWWLLLVHAPTSSGIIPHTVYHMIWNVPLNEKWLLDNTQFSNSVKANCMF